MKSLRTIAGRLALRALLVRPVRLVRHDPSPRLRAARGVRDAGTYRFPDAFPTAVPAVAIRPVIPMARRPDGRSAGAFDCPRRAHSHRMACVARSRRAGQRRREANERIHGRRTSRSPRPASFRGGLRLVLLRRCCRARGRLAARGICSRSRASRFDASCTPCESDDAEGRTPRAGRARTPYPAVMYEDEPPRSGMGRDPAARRTARPRPRADSRADRGRARTALRLRARALWRDGARLDAVGSPR